ncbi:MAG TPA: hypothetical protein VN032_04475 [Thermoanaerobaculia bacterium]|jgi:hypothetical protein|nr:hypothetical protein [Thermoanaerobaculia bacterium]
MRNLKNRFAAVVVLALAAGLGLSGTARAAEPAADKGETAAAKKLRGRAKAPTAADIDAAATLAALLAKDDKAAFSEAKGATIVGWVVQSEKEEDGDFHIALAAEKGETDTRKWMVVEVTPAWQKKSAALAPAALRKLVGTKVQVTGWLYYEPDEDQPDPRGTRWEIHPVTAIVPAK